MNELVKNRFLNELEKIREVNKNWKSELLYKDFSIKWLTVLLPF